VRFWPTLFFFFFFNGKYVCTHTESEYLPLGYVEGLGERKKRKSHA
jgi:hypothetical protein